MEKEILTFFDPSEFAVLQDIAFQGGMESSGRRQGLGRREHQLVGMLPPEAAGYLWFETYIRGGVPLIQKGVFHQRLIEPEDEITQGWNFIPGIGIVQTDGAAVTRRKHKKNQKGKDRE